VSKHYWTVTEDSALADGLAAAQTRVPAGWRMPLAGELPSHPDREVTTAIDVRDVYDHKVRALAAHATQVTVSSSRTEYALSNNIIQPIFAEEHYILVSGERGPSGPGGRELDLFGGL
jgi:N-acetyl-1-D-myo-inositol-2-amino-2-deoxy-alpha-D-glucopyranoside deacetylase